MIKKKWKIGFICLSIFLGMGSVYAIYQNRPFNHRLAAFVTDLSARTPEQLHNIELSSQSIDGIIIKSQKSFSFNQSAGPYTEARGYLPERSFLHGQVVDTSGGGVCQVSSTLFNSVKLAHLDITERVPHSQKVQSVAQGQDATLAYGVADLKFLNNYPFPIKIRSRISQEQLKIEIWGKELNHEIK